jgi:hypothetical protein
MSLCLSVALSFCHLAFLSFTFLPCLYVYLSVCFFVICLFAHLSVFLLLFYVYLSVDLPVCLSVSLSYAHSLICLFFYLDFCLSVDLSVRLSFSFYSSMFVCQFIRLFVLRYINHFSCPSVCKFIVHLYVSLLVCMLVCRTNCVYAPFLCFTLFNWPADDVRLSICLSLCPSVYVFVCLNAISLSVHFLCLFMCPSFHLSAHLPDVMSLFVYLYVSLSVCLYLCYLLVHFPSDSLSICLFILMSVFPLVCLFTNKLPSTKPHPLMNKTLLWLQVAFVPTLLYVYYLPLHSSVSQSICLFILMSVFPLVCLFTNKLPSTKPHPLMNKTLQWLQAHVYTFAFILFLIVHLKLVFN